MQHYQKTQLKFFNSFKYVNLASLTYEKTAFLFYIFGFKDDHCPC